jgi:hypothetical protein
MKKVSLMLTNGLSPADKKQVEDSLNSNEVLLKQIYKVLKDKIKSSREEQQSKSAFMNAAWPYLQADANGYQRAISEILTLLQPREQSDHDR